ncbi:unnamed protein product [Rotaria sordida]|uniref:Uncharacterized protein n=1 Tax=Rotaria sordida TaxID=392033 RepID=A0A814BDW2_9BILA|nr:unnamed protein product [Rotaria sordida]
MNFESQSHRSLHQQNDINGKIYEESIITFKILNDHYQFDEKSYLFIVHSSYSNQPQNNIKSNLKLLLEIQDIKVCFINPEATNCREVLVQSLQNCKSTIPVTYKEFSCGYQHIKELQYKLEEKPNCLREVYYLNSLLKEADVQIEEKEDLLVFSYKNIPYFYDHKKNILTCSNNQGIKLLHKKGLDILKYLLKRDILFSQSKQIKNQLDKGTLDKTIVDFLKQTSECLHNEIDNETRQRIDEIDEIIFTLEDEFNRNTNEKILQLQIKLRNFEQTLEMQNLDNEIQKKKDQIQMLSKKVIHDDEIIQDNDDKLDDLLQIQRFRFDCTFDSNEIHTSKEIRRKQYEKTIEWDKFDIHREQKDVNILEKYLYDENEALTKLKEKLDNKNKMQGVLEKRKEDLETKDIPRIEGEMEELRTEQLELEEKIKNLETKKDELEKQKKDKVREKRTKDIFKDVGGSEEAIEHEEKKYHPHKDCINSPKSKYKCQYMEAVREAVDFVSDKIETEESIDIEATKLELLKELSEEGYKHSVGEIQDGRATGEHVEDLKKVVDEIERKRKELADEEKSISRDYQKTIDEKILEISDVEGKKIDNNKDQEIKQGDLEKARIELKNNQVEIFETKQAIKLIESTIKQKTDIIQMINEKKCISDARLSFSKEYNKIKQKHDIKEKLEMYTNFLHNVIQIDEGSKLIREECLRQIKHLNEYQTCLNDRNQNDEFNSETNHHLDAMVTQNYSNLENKYQDSHTTDVSSENNEQKLEHLENELFGLNLKKKQIELNIQKENIVHKVEVIKLQLNYFESLSEIKDIRNKSILLHESSSVNSRTHYGFELRGKIYAFQLPDPENYKDQLDNIQKINRIIKLVDSIDKQIIQLKAKRQILIDQSKITSEEQTFVRFKNIERYLLNRSIRLSGFDRFSNGMMLNQTESLISVLISEIIDRSHLYQIDGSNFLDPLIEQGVMKILKNLKNNQDICQIISEINQEYSDEGCFSKVTILNNTEETEYKLDISHIEVQNSRALFLFKFNNLYFILKHEQKIKLVDDESLNLKLNINKYVSDMAEETDLFENLCETRIRYCYKKNLEKSNTLAEICHNEISQMSKIYSIREFNGEFSSYSNSTLFYFLSNLDENLDRLELKLNKSNFEIEEISNFSLIKIKDLYKSAIIKVLSREQERRKQMRLEKITKSDNEENNLAFLIQQEEERERQLLEKLNKKQEEIFKIETNLNKIIDELNRSETAYRKHIDFLEQQRKDILKELNDMNEELRQLSQDMISNEIKIRKIKYQIEQLSDNLNTVQKKIDTTEAELDQMMKRKLTLEHAKVDLEAEKNKIQIDRKHEEDKLKEKQAEINQNEAWIKFLQNLTEAFLSEQVNKSKQSILNNIKSTKNLSVLYKKLKTNRDLQQFLFKDLNKDHVDKYIEKVARSSDGINLRVKLKQLTHSFLSSINGQLVSELGLDIHGNPIQIKKYKISVIGSVSYQEVHQSVKDKIEREIKCQIGGLVFNGDYLTVKHNGINSLADLPKEIKSLIDDRIKINYQQHEWEDRLSRKYKQAVNQLNALKISYKQIVNCYVDLIEIQCGGIFLLDSDDYYPGIDLIVRARQMKCGNQRKPVSLITTGSDAPEFAFSRASDGYQRRKHKHIPEGHSGFDGENGRDGQHAGNIFIKIDDTIECLDLLKSIELCGGKGGSGQLGGNGDKGYRGTDGKNGIADDTRGFAGGQTTFAFGQIGTKSGDGGDGGLSGRGGSGGLPGKLSISDNRGDLFELIKDRIQQKEGLPGTDPDLSSSAAPKGGEGGDPTIIGMDQVKNKKSFFHKTTTEIGEVDIDYLLEKNPYLRKEIEERQKCGNRGIPNNVAIPIFLLAPLPLALLPLLINQNIHYRMSKNEEQYKLNPRRDRNTKGISKENQTSGFRHETKQESEVVKRDFPNTSNLDQSVSEKQSELSEIIEKNLNEQKINKLKLDKQDIDNNIEKYRSQEHSLEIDINIQGQDMETLETQINEYQNELTQLRQETLELTQAETLKIGQELNLMTEQQNLRDRRNETQLSQTISLSKLESYSELHKQYRIEYDKMKEFLDKLKQSKESQLKNKQEEKAQIENKLATLKGQLQENRRKLTKFKDEKLKLLKEEIILSEDILQNTELEEQHEHEYEINWLQDSNINIPRIRKIYLNKIEKCVFTPFARKIFNQFTNYDENYEELWYFHLHSFLNDINQYFNNDDKSIELVINWLIKFDLRIIPFSEIIQVLHNFSSQQDNRIKETLMKFETEHKLAIVNEFNPYCLLRESLKTLKNIGQTSLNDIRFDLNQIERHYRGIHYSYEIEIQQINQCIDDIRIEIDNLKDLELNKIPIS